MEALIVALETLIHSTRDSGYKKLSSAVSELFDNALQANSSRIDITMRVDGSEGKQPRKPGNRRSRQARHGNDDGHARLHRLGHQSARRRVERRA